MSSRDRGMRKRQAIVQRAASTDIATPRDVIYRLYIPCNGESSIVEHVFASDSPGAMHAGLAQLSMPMNHGEPVRSGFVLRFLTCEHHPESMSAIHARQRYFWTRHNSAKDQRAAWDAWQDGDEPIGIQFFA